MYWICHDIGSPIARLLGESCPMIDIEHVVLYDRRTIRMLFENAGFQTLKVFGVSNRYPLEYWATLAPLSCALKSWLLRLLRATRLGRIPITANFGNLGIFARKPAVP